MMNSKAKKKPKLFHDVLHKGLFGDEWHQALQAITLIVDRSRRGQSLPQPKVEEILSHLRKSPQLTGRKFVFHRESTFGSYTAGICLPIFVFHSAKEKSLEECIKLHHPNSRQKALQKTIDTLWKLTGRRFTMKDDSGLIWLLKQCHQHYEEEEEEEKVYPTKLLNFFLCNWNKFDNKNNGTGFMKSFSTLVFSYHRPPITLTRLHLAFNVEYIGDLIRCGDRVVITSLTLTGMENFGDGANQEHIIQLIKNQSKMKHLDISGTFTFDNHWISPLCDALATHCPQLGTLNLMGGNINPGNIFGKQQRDEIAHHSLESTAAGLVNDTCWEIDRLFSEFTKNCSSLVHLNVIGCDWRGQLGEESRQGHFPPMIIVSSDMTPWITWKQTLSCILGMIDDEWIEQFNERFKHQSCWSCYKTAMQNWLTCQGRQALTNHDLESLLKAILDPPPQLGSIVEKCSLPQDTKYQLKECCSAPIPGGQDVLLVNLKYNLLRQHAGLWS